MANEHGDSDPSAPAEPAAELAQAADPIAAEAPAPGPPPAAPAPPQPGPPLFQPPPPSARRRGGCLGGLIKLVLVVVFVIPLVWVAIVRLVPPPVTPLMLIRLPEGNGLDYRWRPISRISPALVQAAIAAEDSRFCEHHGFDYRAIEKAMAHNERRPGRIRGGSTISQQTAKNVFLWQGRSYLRKGLEAYFTVLTEGLWGKRRIMETYLNVVEWGPGIYGAEAAAQRYFGTDAAHLTNVQASRLAAILPSPLKWRADAPGAYVQKRSRRIGGAMGTVRIDGLAACVGRLSGFVPREPPIEDAAPPPPPRAASAPPASPTPEPEPSSAPPPAPDAAPSASSATPSPDE